jgi:hypothetical protein
MFKRTTIAVAIATLTGVAALPAAAQQPGQQGRDRAAARLEVTMTLLPDKASGAGDITRHIELPAPAPTQGAANGKSPTGIPGADHGKGQGLETAAEAREGGREFGQEAAEQARDNRESAGRRDDHPTGPPVDLPVTPHSGGPPDTVPAPAKP